MTRCLATSRFTDPRRTVHCELDDGHRGQHIATVPDGPVTNTYIWPREPQVCATAGCDRLALIDPTYCHRHDTGEGTWTR